MRVKRNNYSHATMYSRHSCNLYYDAQLEPLDLSLKQKCLEITREIISAPTTQTTPPTPSTPTLYSPLLHSPPTIFIQYKPGGYIKVEPLLSPEISRKTSSASSEDEHPAPNRSTIKQENREKDRKFVNNIADDYTNAIYNNEKGERPAIEPPAQPLPKPTRIIGKPYKCDFDSCRNSFKTAHMLKIHKSLHDRNRCVLFKCDICDRVFHKLGLLNKHNYSSKHKCEVCKRDFCSLQSLKRHSASENCSNKPLVCKKCDCTFTSYREFDQHTQTHKKMRRKKSTLKEEQAIKK